MKNLTQLFVICLLFYACSNNPEPTDTTKKGADFMKEEKPRVDLTKIDVNAPVVKVTLKANGNTMADMLFDKDTIRVPANSTVVLTLQNASTDSSMQHNFVLVEEGSIQVVADAGVKAGVDKNFVPDIEEVLIASKLTMPGEKTSIQFSVPAKGNYEFMCSYPGHYARMKGIFIVE